MGEDPAGVGPACAPRLPNSLLAGLVGEEDLVGLVVEGDLAGAAVGFGSAFVDLPAVLDELGGDGQRSGGGGVVDPSDAAGIRWVEQRIRTPGQTRVELIPEA